MSNLRCFNNDNLQDWYIYNTSDELEERHSTLCRSDLFDDDIPVQYRERMVTGERADARVTSSFLH